MNSKNKRKFRSEENKFLFQTYEKAAQIQATIEEKLATSEDPKELPQSIIPTGILYDVVSMYCYMYDKLLDEDLIIAGYPKSKHSTH